MELKRIVAQDLRTATQEAVRLYGPTTLVVSSERINGKMEVIAAVDIKAEPEIKDFNSKIIEKRVVQTSSLSEEIAGESFENILSESLEKKRVAKVAHQSKFNGDGEKLIKTDHSNEEIHGQFLKQREKETMKASIEPKFNMKDFANTIKPVEPKTPEMKTPPQTKIELSKIKIEDTNLKLEKNEIDNESLRAREIVDLVLREFSDMKKEFKLAQKVALFNSSSQVPIEIKSVVDSLNEANIPVGLRTMLIEGIADCSSFDEAVEALKLQLKNSINAEKKILDNVPYSGIHVVSGPTGSGKTSMLMKIIASATQKGISDENIAVISYKDTRLGAWSQTQMSCAQVGVEAFKVKDIAFLKTLCEELGGKTLVLIDTAGIGREKNLEEIKSTIDSVDFHLVLASDSSPSAFENLTGSDNFDWKSLFVSKFDESVSPWGLLQSIIKSNITIASIWGTGPSSFDFEDFNKEQLVEKAFQTLMIADDDQVLMNKESNKMIFETFEGFNSEGVQ
jgi:flagellar biosynthesis protein FlhF